MELRHLRYFLGVAEQLSFTKAALKLRVAQPALSRQVRQLEEELGVALFERNHREVRLTTAGQAFAIRAREVLAQASLAIDAARHPDPGACALHLGYVWGLFHSIAPPILHALRQRLPQVSAHLLDLSAAEQAEALRAGKLDAGFIGFAFEADAAGLSRQSIGKCDWLIALPKDHRAARQSRVRLASLAGDFFLTISQQTYPGALRQMLEICSQAGFRPRILQTAERGFTLLSLVAANCGVALLPAPLQALPHPGVRFRPIAEETSSDLFIAWNPARLKPECRQLLEACHVPHGV